MCWGWARAEVLPIYLWFGKDSDALAEEEQELEAPSAEKTKLMTKGSNGIKREIKAKGQKLGMVISFK